MHAEKADDWVVATGEHYSVAEFTEEVFKQLGLDCYDYITFSEEYKRPNEVPDLRGDPSKIMKELGWQPKIKFKELISMMVDCCMRN
jgi:GDPmannose 4,6-dehydratase